jgi:hypothetical protein
MLVRERKRALWSFGVGVILAVAVEGGLRVLDWQATRRLEASIAHCEKSPLRAGEEHMCKPEDWHGLQVQKPDGTFERLTDEDLLHEGWAFSQIIRDYLSLKRYRDGELFYSVILLALSSLPLIWYFLLDRIREISGAVSGRDRTP